VDLIHLPLGVCICKLLGDFKMSEPKIGKMLFRHNPVEQARDLGVSFNNERPNQFVERAAIENLMNWWRKRPINKNTKRNDKKDR
jgi:hypothetical protein